MGISAGHNAAIYGFGSSSPPIMRNLARTVEVWMQTLNKQQIIMLCPVRIVPGIVDDVHFHIRRKKSCNHRSYLRLEYATVVRTPSMVIRVDGNHACPHLQPSSPA